MDLLASPTMPSKWSWAQRKAVILSYQDQVETERCWWYASLVGGCGVCIKVLVTQVSVLATIKHTLQHGCYLTEIQDMSDAEEPLERERCSTWCSLPLILSSLCGVFGGEWGKVKKRVKGDFKLGMISLVAEGQTQLQAFLLLSKEMALKKPKITSNHATPPKKTTHWRANTEAKRKSEICLQLFYGWKIGKTPSKTIEFGSFFGKTKIWLIYFMFLHLY